MSHCYISPSHTAVVLRACAIVAPAGARAQMTAVERATARDVVARIEALQAQLDPARTAQPLPRRGDAYRDAILRRVEALWEGEMHAPPRPLARPRS